MITTKTQNKYLELMSASEMHQASKKWYSELSFIKDEQLFLDDLVTTYTLQLINKEEFADTTEIVDVLNRSQKRNNELLNIVRTHTNDLEVLVDNIKQPKEEVGYKKEHKELIKVISEFFIDYKNLKTQLFQIFKNILKDEKQIRLLNRE
ncbi:hypothetical protein Q4512_04315 [Oceanihabitans sp. 2_MG-2023]|uniref:hypothetical protein n=1 Tax=Oceanihabitans sp. 2_MG-2023 TaxID=3062661 RepID=UPI0026E36D8D|nr:hypothetical protein [Oceanihabitans sp. 2_MG-2023]MDO6596127.1 hypothetical protein [Oceanihabitans sp. 2_MG-2023]